MLLAGLMQNHLIWLLYRPVKKQIILKIDADILAWLRQQGAEGYQSRLNALLRGVMLRDLESKRKRV